MNPEELFERLIRNEISREEFERLLDGFDDEDILARYEIYLQGEFEKEVEDHLAKNPGKGETQHMQLKVTKKFKSKKKSDRKRGDFPIAAVLILFVGLVFSVMFIVSQYGGGSEKTQIAKSTLTPEIIHKSTPKGRKFRMTLNDGSFVHLNSASSITYPNKFEDSSRDIEIMGEAYFKIQNDQQRPFNIKVKDYNVQVLGTSFNVQAYDDEDDFSVTVESGKVKVILDENGSNTAILEQDQKLIYNPETNVTEIINVNSTDDLSWRAGILKFNSTPLSDVVKTLDRWYGVQVIIEDEHLEKLLISGTHKNKNLRAVLEALTYMTRTKYEIKENSIIIKN